MRDIPAAEAKEVADLLGSYGVGPEAAAPLIVALKARPEAWVDFMMRFELGLDQPEPKRAVISAATIAGAYVAGGLIPLPPPIFFFTVTGRALVLSSLLALACSAT